MMEILYQIKKRLLMSSINVFVKFRKHFEIDKDELFLVGASVLKAYASKICTYDINAEAATGGVL